MKLFAKKPKKYLTFLFTDSSIKVAQLDPTGRQLKLFFELALPSEVIVDGEVKDSERLKKCLLAVGAKVKQKNSFVIVGISETKASTHVITFPLAETSEIDQAIKIQSETFLPFPYQSEYLDWMLIEKNQEGSKVLLSAVSKSVIDGFVDAFRTTTYRPIAFEITSLSLFRLLPQDEKKACFAAWVDETSVVLILGRNRNIEACSVIKEKDIFAQTLERMRDYYLKGEVEDKDLKVYLAGKAVSNSLIEQIQQKLSLNVVVLKPNVLGVPSGRETELALLTSLAQKEVMPPEDERSINILPESLSEEYLSGFKRRQEIKTLFLLIFLFLVLNLLNGFLFFKIKNETNRMNLKINPAVPSFDEVEKDILVLKEKAQTITQISSSNNNLLTALEEIVFTSLDKIDITSFYFDSEKKEANVSGFADYRTSLLALKENLEKKDYIAKVIIPLSSLEKEEKAEFNLIIILK